LLKRPKHPSLSAVVSDLRRKLAELAMSEAAQYGEAKSKSVMGKAMGKYPELRSSAKEIMQIIDDVIDEANSLSTEELQPYLPVKKKKVEKEVIRELPPLDNTDSVVLRFAPGPSGPLHLGHTRALALNNYYKNRYNGKLILRLEDTNPNAIDPDAYSMIESDLEWLGIDPDEVVVQSDRIQLYYDEIRKIIGKGGAYVTNSDAEEWRELKRQSKAHPDRERPSEVQLSDFEALLSDGEGIVVIKTDLDDPNPALRDFVAFRVVESEHPKQSTKYRLWPLYNYAVAIDDYHLGITHVLRGKDHLNNTLKQNWIYKYLEWDEPDYIHYGLVSIPNTNLKTSKIRESIQNKEFSGWDDCRLATLKGLARRGYRPETFLKYWENSGLKEVDIKFSWQNFNAMNKDFIDSVSRRLFFVADPVEFIIETDKALTKDAPWHPDKPEWGKREEVISSGSKIYLQKEDVDSFKEGQDIRLKNLCNVTVKGNKLIFAGMKPQKGNQILQWCSSNASIELVYPDGNSATGMVEDNISELDGETVQFERVGFVRLEGKKAFFLHR